MQTDDFMIDEREVTHLEDILLSTISNKNLGTKYNISLMSNNIS